MNRARWNRVFDGLCYVALTILVWGVNALQRGPWQDDIQALYQAFWRSTAPFRYLFAPDVGPLRRLTVIPSAIAYATPHPIWALQIMCAAIWLTQGLFAGWIVGLLLPGRRRIQFLVVCLTLTATSDLTTGSMITLGYQVGATLLLAALGCALVWIERGRMAALFGSVILLLSSLLTMDVAIPALPFLVMLFVGLGIAGVDREAWRRIKRRPWTVISTVPGRRVIGLLLGWGTIVIPIAIAEWVFLHDPASYASVALVPIPKATLIERAIKLWLVNFAPWLWAFARPGWWIRPARIIRVRWMAAGALLAVSIFLARLRTRKDDPELNDGLRSVLLAALFVMMAFAANAAYAFVQFSEVIYRTQILSRIWASIAIGIFAAWVGTRGKPVVRWSAIAVVTGFVFFGTWGGIERQDYFLSVWRWHQRELTSILNAAPALSPDTAVILRGTPPSGRYLATEADYLAGSWLRLLYQAPALQTLRLNPQRGTGCKSVADGLECWTEGQGDCVANQTCVPLRVRLDHLVLMDYDGKSGTYQLVPSLAHDPLVTGHENDAGQYNPGNRVLHRPWTVLQRRLLLK